MRSTSQNFINGHFTIFVFLMCDWLHDSLFNSAFNRCLLVEGKCKSFSKYLANQGFSYIQQVNDIGAN